MSIPTPEALNGSRLSTREFADAQLRNPNLTPGEHAVAWFLFRRSSKPDCGVLDGATLFGSEE